MLLLSLTINQLATSNFNCLHVWSLNLKWVVSHGWDHQQLINNYPASYIASSLTYIVMYSYPYMHTCFMYWMSIRHLLSGSDVWLLVAQALMTLSWNSLVQWIGGSIRVIDHKLCDPPNSSCTTATTCKINCMNILLANNVSNNFLLTFFLILWFYKSYYTTKSK